jgi:hypothetical protein
VSAEITFEDDTVDLDTLAVGDVVIQAWAQVTAVFNAGTTNVITLGNGTTADKFLAAADVTEGSTGVTPAGGKGPFTAETAAGTLRVTYAQTGTAASTGAARVYALVTSAPE